MSGLVEGLKGFVGEAKLYLDFLRFARARVRWLFVLGCTNSGTTLLSYLLSLHPQIDPLGYIGCEGQWSWHMITPKGVVEGRLFTENLDKFRNPQVNVRLVKAEWLNKRRGWNGLYVLEKSPPDSVRSLWLQEHFSPAWFIGIIRNGYAVAEGIRRKANVPVARSGRHWNKTVKIMLEDSEHLERFTLIRYEELTTRPLDVLRELEHWLGLQTFGDYQTITKGAIDMKIGHLPPSKIVNKNPLSFTNLSNEDTTDIYREAGEMLEKLNYRKR